MFEPAAVGAVPYLDLRIRRATTRFVEDGIVPSDSQVVDRTWKYVNKKGGLLGRPVCSGPDTQPDETSSLYLVPRCCNQAGTNCGSGDVAYDVWHLVDAVQTSYRATATP